MTRITPSSLKFYPLIASYHWHEVASSHIGYRCAAVPGLRAVARAWAGEEDSSLYCLPLDSKGYVAVHVGGQYWGGLFMGLPASRLGIDA